MNWLQDTNTITQAIEAFSALKIAENNHQYSSKHTDNLTIEGVESIISKVKKNLEVLEKSGSPLYKKIDKDRIVHNLEKLVQRTTKDFEQKTILASSSSNLHKFFRSQFPTQTP